MGAQWLSVRMQRSLEAPLPLTVTMFAIWMTGSLSASGKTPGRPAHSMSSESTEKGASLSHSPSAACACSAL